MSTDNEGAGTGATLAEVKSAAEDLLSRIAGTDLTDTDLFPHGITQVAVTVRAGGIVVKVEMGGPDHGDHDDEEWSAEDMDDLFEDEEE